jgi:prevent-host-death family protein
VKSLPVSRAHIGKVFDAVVASGQPVRLTSHGASVVLVDEQQWRALEETLYRLSAPALSGAAVPGSDARMQGETDVRH